MSTSNSLRGACLVVLALSLLSAGCGKKTAIVRGKVDYGDKKPAGVVRFVAEDGTVAEGSICMDGTYEILEAPIGNCKVSISTAHLEKKGGMGPGGMGPGGGGPIPGAPPGGISAGGGMKAPPDAEKRVTQAPKMDAATATPGGGKQVNTTLVPIPAKYKTPEGSGLTFEVKKGDNEYNITITGK